MDLQDFLGNVPELIKALEEEDGGKYRYVIQNLKEAQMQGKRLGVDNGEASPGRQARLRAERGEITPTARETHKTRTSEDSPGRKAVTAAAQESELGSNAPKTLDEARDRFEAAHKEFLDSLGGNGG